MQIIATSDTNTKPYIGNRLGQLIADRTGSQALAQEVRVISQLLPFKINQFAADHLIDWKNTPKDPMYRLLVPHRDMLSKEDFLDIEQALDNKAQLNATVSRLRSKLNPHPGDQLNLNVPASQAGLQHKYQETVLVFPKQSQTCHSYCSYCFRWAQFVGDKTLKMAVDSPESMVSYLKQHPKVTDVLFTGGDPLVMKTEKLQAYIEPLLLPEFDHIKNIRIGTKALAFYPYRITYGFEADALLRLSEKIIAKKKHLAYMLHYSHPRELEHSLSKVAIKRLLMTGAQLRSQAPILRHINDSAQIWADMWKTQVSLGIHPYYMFVERDTGAQNYFGLPLMQAYHIYTEAFQQVSGLARTARGPVMSATPGKIQIEGELNLPQGKAIVLKYLQAREPSKVGIPFLAKGHSTARWWDDLEPFSDADRLFFE